MHHLRDRRNMLPQRAILKSLLIALSLLSASATLQANPPSAAPMSPAKLDLWSIKPITHPAPARRAPKRLGAKPDRRLHSYPPRGQQAPLRPRPTAARCCVGSATISPAFRPRPKKFPPFLPMKLRTPIQSRLSACLLPPPMASGGAPLARRRSLCRQQRFRDEPAASQCLALPRLRHPRLQRR